jgi:glutaredoxin-like YruB-family protein
MAVKIYSTPSCGYCTLAKNWLKEKGISYEDYNVAADQRKAEEMVRKSGQMGVPVIDVNGKIIVGFNKPEIEKALK